MLFPNLTSRHFNMQRSEKQVRRSSADAYVGPHAGRFACSWTPVRHPAHYMDRATERMSPGAVVFVPVWSFSCEVYTDESQPDWSGRVADRRD